MNREKETEVSVLMLTYNRERLVSRAIQSILAQTFTGFEFIIVDNGSKDKSGEIAEYYSASDARIRVIHREKGSIGAGRNSALLAASGKYITFLDDDDWAEPDFLSFLVSLIREEDADVAICGWDDRKFEKRLVMTAEEAVMELLRRKRFTAGFPMKLIKREAFGSLRFPEDVRCDDIAVMYRLLANCGRVVYQGAPKYHVFRHPGNHSAWTTDYRLLSPEILEEYREVYRTRTVWLSEHFPDRKEEIQYTEWSFLISMVEKIVNYQRTECEKQKHQICQRLHKEKEEILASPYLLKFEKEWMERYVCTE